MEFLDPIPPGLNNDEMMGRLRHSLEGAANRLSEEAGGPVVPLDAIPLPTTPQDEAAPAEPARAAGDTG